MINHVTGGIGLEPMQSASKADVLPIKRPPNNARELYQLVRQSQRDTISLPPDDRGAGNRTKNTGSKCVCKLLRLGRAQAAIITSRTREVNRLDYRLPCDCGPALGKDDNATPIQSPGRKRGKLVREIP